MARGIVITTHLRTGNPNGIRTGFISNKICEMIVFPKSEFDMVSQSEETEKNVMSSLQLCRNIQKTASGNYCATMYWPVRVQRPVIAQAAVATDGCTGLTMLGNR